MVARLPIKAVRLGSLSPRNFINAMCTTVTVHSAVVICLITLFLHGTEMVCVCMYMLVLNAVCLRHELLASRLHAAGLRSSLVWGTTDFADCTLFGQKDDPNDSIQSASG